MLCYVLDVFIIRAVKQLDHYAPYHYARMADVVFKANILPRLVLKRYVQHHEQRQLFCECNIMYDSIKIRTVELGANHCLVTKYIHI